MEKKTEVLQEIQQYGDRPYVNNIALILDKKVSYHKIDSFDGLIRKNILITQKYQLEEIESGYQKINAFIKKNEAEIIQAIELFFYEYNKII